MHPKKNLNSLDEWLVFWAVNDVCIKDEYGNVIDWPSMVSIICDRSSDEVSFCSPEVLARNHAVPGPNGLLRSVVDGVHCVGHGEGPWDYIATKFS